MLLGITTRHNHTRNVVLHFIEHSYRIAHPSLWKWTKRGRQSNGISLIPIDSAETLPDDPSADHNDWLVHHRCTKIALPKTLAELPASGVSAEAVFRELKIGEQTLPIFDASFLGLCGENLRKGDIVFISHPSLSGTYSVL
jgi:hypothetical protein